jgi:hypothetical protein
MPGRLGFSFFRAACSSFTGCFKDVNMKKVFCSMALAAFVCASFVGCGGEAPKETKKAAPAPATAPKEAPKEAKK